MGIGITGGRKCVQGWPVGRFLGKTQIIGESGGLQERMVLSPATTSLIHSTLTNFIYVQESYFFSRRGERLRRIIALSIVMCLISIGLLSFDG